MITASHNPPRYNGIKLKAAYGGSASPADAKNVEERVRANVAAGKTPLQMEMDLALAQGLVTRFDPLPGYEAHLATLVDFDAIRRAGLTVAVDAMYGAGRVYLRRLLQDAGCTVTELRGEMNPGFNGIHPEPIERHLQPLIAGDDARASTAWAWPPTATPTASARWIPSGRFVDPHCIMACCWNIWSTSGA